MLFTLTVTVSPSFQVFPHTSKPASSLPPIITPPASLGTQGSGSQFCGGHFAKLWHTSISQARSSLRDLDQLCRALLKAWRFQPLRLLHSIPKPCGQMLLPVLLCLCHLSVPLSLFSLLIPIYPIPGSKFLIKFIGVQSVFLTRP